MKELRKKLEEIAKRIEDYPAYPVINTSCNDCYEALILTLQIVSMTNAILEVMAKEK